jgi:hypothetical protein
MFGNRTPLISYKKIRFKVEVFKSNFFSPIIKDSITETPKNVKMSNKSSQKLLEIDF